MSAIAASLGAAVAVPALAAAGAAALGLAVASFDRRSRAWMVVVIVLVATVAAGRAGAGSTSTPPTIDTPSGRVHGWATVAEDARPLGRAVRSVVVLDGVRYEVLARDADVARSVSTWRVGSRVRIEGHARPARATVPTGWRRVDAALEVTSIGVVHVGAPVHRSADRIRDWVGRGADRLGSRAGLFRGFVLGDRGRVDAHTVERFRRSGLSHLLVVSGLNVALVLVPLGPLLVRTRPVVRVASVVLVLGWFVILTRAEPSVVRAATMAALAACARWRGHDREPFRLLCLAVTLIVTVDPSIVRSVGWWLSVGATAGVCTLGRWLAERLRLPRPLAGAVGISIGAQVGVAIPMWLTIGPVPVLGVVANVLAVPVASLVKMYGLPASVIAGVVDPVAPWAATVVMWPVGPGLWWTERVAAVAADAAPGAVASIALWVALATVTLVSLGPAGGTTSSSDGDPPPDR